jgi:hypothetical protein
MRWFQLSKPKAGNSASWEPAPSPAMIRPPLISSAVSMIFAKRPGLRHGVTLTIVPISTRSVTAATAQTIDQHSHVPKGSMPGMR